MSPMTLFHILAGSVGILSGAFAMSARKGSRKHAVAGRVFVVSMLCMSSSGAYIAGSRWLETRHSDQVGNFLAALFTFYLVATGWWTALQHELKAGVAARIAG